MADDRDRYQTNRAVTVPDLDPLTIAEVADGEPDAVHAAIALIGRAGATDFAFGYGDPDDPSNAAGRPEPLPGARVFYARANFQGRTILVEGYASPADAADAIVARCLEGGGCADCGRTLTFGINGQKCELRRVGATWTKFCTDADPDVHWSDTHMDRCRAVYPDPGADT